MQLAHETIILVADGTRMLLLCNKGNLRQPDLKVIEHRQFDNPQDRDLSSDAPGLGFSRGHPGRSTLDEADLHQANEDRFLAASAAALALAAANGRGDIVVAAPPRALGELRRHYAPVVQQRLVAEIDSDFTKHPIDEITRLLSAHGERAAM